MDALSLPILTSTDTPETAIRVMAEMKRSAVVVDAGGSYRLMYGGDVARARRDLVGSLDLMEVQGPPVHAITSQEHDAFKIDVLRPTSTAHNFELLLQNVGSEYGILSTTREEAIVITAHETLVDVLVMPGTFECDGPVVHFFPRPKVVVGQRCPACGALGLSSTITYVLY